MPDSYPVEVFRNPCEWAVYCQALAHSSPCDASPSDISAHSTSGSGPVASSPSTDIGFVPTMGALHRGHAELIRRSIAENDITLISIFVNPTQFNNPDDLSGYPRTLDADLALVAELGVRAVFLPTPDSMYPDDYTCRIQETSLSSRMEGQHRPGHFDGVLTVVMKLLLLTRARRAYFGEKDYQQYVLIRNMAQAFFLRDAIGTEIIPCPIIREDSGLAFSSRNRRLSSSGLQTAAHLPDILEQAGSADQAAEQLRQAGFTVEYVEDSQELSAGCLRRFAAVELEGVRLIDNLPRERGCTDPDTKPLSGGHHD